MSTHDNLGWREIRARKHDAERAARDAVKVLDHPDDWLTSWRRDEKTKALLPKYKKPTKHRYRRRFTKNGRLKRKRIMPGRAFPCFDKAQHAETQWKWLRGQAKLVHGYRRNAFLADDREGSIWDGRYIPRIDDGA